MYRSSGWCWRWRKKYHSLFLFLLGRVVLRLLNLLFFPPSSARLPTVYMDLTVFYFHFVLSLLSFIT